MRRLPENTPKPVCGRRAIVAIVVLLLSGVAVSADRVGADSGLSAWAAGGPDPIPWQGSPTIPVTKGASTSVPPAEPRFPEPARWTVDLGAARPDAGDHPVVVTPSGKQATSGALEVAVLDRGTAKRVGVSGFVFTVADRGAGGARPGELSVDYSGFANANGGDFAARLKVVALPECVLADPLPKGCDTTGVALPTDNDLQGRKLRTRVENLGALAVLAVTAGTESDFGTYRASPMTPSAAWNVSTGTGDFTYSYPIQVPATAGGTPPSVGLSYSSGAVDGLTLATNSQSTQAGLGWSDFSNAFIERSYQPCVIDEVFTSNDLCWTKDNATISLNGVSGTLVPLNSAGTEWRLREDPGWKVERDDGAAYTNIYGHQRWEVTTPDGTRFFFGFGHMPGRFTNSVLSVPVFGDQPEDPCYDATVHIACDQGWRWYLDRVEDPNGNVRSLLYQKEVNYYKPYNGWGNLRAAYDRNAYLTEIIYGGRVDQWDENYFGARVTFGTRFRCVFLDDRCNAGPLPWNGMLWVDVPNDLVCDANPDNACGPTAPTFFSSVRYSHVRTEVKIGSEWRPIAQHNLWHEFPDSSTSGVVRKLQLRSLQQAGLAFGGLDAYPHTEFGYQYNDNRANHSGQISLAMRHDRLNYIKTALGDQISIQYTLLNECYSYTTSRWDLNPRTCFPQSIRSEDGSPREGVFYKYLVSSVIETPEQGSPGSAIQTSYAYEGSPAWAFDRSAFARSNPYKGWSRWLGFGATLITNGSSKTRVRTHRGWHNDPVLEPDPFCPCRSERVQVGPALVEDVSILAGRTIEEIEYGTVGGVADQVARSTLYEYDVKTTPNPTGSAEPTWAEPKRTTESVATAPGQFRQRRSETTYNERRQPTSTMERGWTDQEVRCSRTTYADSPERWMFSYPATNQMVAGACTSTQVLTSSQIYYDGGALNAAPTKGNPTRQRTLVDAAAGSWSETSTGFDDFGRPTEVTDPLGRKMLTAYGTQCGPLPGGGCAAYTVVQAPVRTTVTNPLAHASVTEWHPELGAPRSTTDANGNRTDFSYDGFGNTTAVRLPTEQGSSDNSWQFSYDVINRVVRSRQLTSGSGNSASYEDSWTIYDGLWRQRQSQTQSPTPGKALVSETTYDERGLVQDERVAQALTGTPGGYISGGPGSQWQNQTQHVYDELRRETVRHWWRQGTVVHSSTTSYTVDTVTATGPDGIRSREKVDGLGRTTAAEELDGQNWVGYTYTYDLADRFTGYTDPAGAIAAHSYNNAGMRTLTWDGATGITNFGYDLAGNQTSATNGGLSVHTGYDALGRPIERHSGSATGPLLAKWSYDAAGKKGLLNSSTSYDTAGRAWVSDIAGYDARGRATGSTLTVPAGVPGLSGSYPVTQTYDKADRVTSTSYPAVGGLPAETVETRYTSLGLPNSLERQGGEGYVRGVQYDDRGRPNAMALGPNQGSGGWLLRGYSYDSDQRLAETSTRTWDGSSYRTVAQHVYGYRNDGNLKERTTFLAGAQRRECYSYDPRARLTESYTVAISASCAAGTRGTGDQPYNHSYRYSPSGNLTQRIENGTSIGYTYPNPGQGSPNAPTRVGADTYQWDPQGRLKQRTVAGSTETLTWDVANHLTKINGTAGETSFVYDATGARLLRSTPSASTLYFPGHEVTANPAGTSVRAVRSYTFQGEVVAIRSASGVDYLVNDGAGSVELAVPSGGAPNATRGYNPYGKVRAETGNTATDRGFLGQIEDDSTKLSYLNARYYDPGIGVFLSPDPLQDTGNIKTLNPYSYSANNPAAFSDPSGLSPNLGQLQKENTALRSENARLRAENQWLKNKILSLQNIIHEQKAMIAALRAQNAALKAQIQHLKATVRALNAKIGQLMHKVRVQQQVISSLQDKLRKQATKIDWLVKTIRGLKGGHTDSGGHDRPMRPAGKTGAMIPVGTGTFYRPADWGPIGWLAEKGDDAIESFGCTFQDIDNYFGGGSCGSDEPGTLEQSVDFFFDPPQDYCDAVFAIDYAAGAAALATRGGALSNLWVDAALLMANTPCVIAAGRRLVGGE